MNIGITIDGIADKLQLINDALLTGKAKLGSGVSIRFIGSPIPFVRRGVNFVDLLWTDKVEIDVPGPVDPDVAYVRIWKDKLEVRLKVGGKVTVTG